MMNEDDYQHFVCIAAGDNPSKLMEPYDKNIKGQKHLVYKFKDAGKLKASYIRVYENLLSKSEIPAQQEYIKMTIQDLSEMDDVEFYESLLEDKEFEIDENTGDAYSYENANGKWSSYVIGKIFSIPFLTKDGREVFQATKGEVDWDKIHLHGGDIYARAWEMVVDGSAPTTDYENTIYENMKDKLSYFEKFETKEKYVISNTAFWGYAFVSEKTGWVDASEVEDQFEWMGDFFDSFIRDLPDDTLLTIYECRK